MKTKILLVFAAAFILAMPNAHAASSFVNGLCAGGGSAGTSPAGGIIPANSILAGQTKGEQSLLNISLLLMLTMFFVLALIYMISYVFNLNLRTFVKAEIGEMIITALIVFVFIGSFNLAAISVNAGSSFHAAGSSFGRNLYVDDCSYLGSSSIGLITPLLTLNLIRLVVGTITSFDLHIEPTDFGIDVKPLQGYSLFNIILGILGDIIWLFITVILGVMLILGFVYGLFPIFLYAGIILRTIPWTRAAGGAFLGLFMGFYIVFPILLHIILAGYVASLSASSISLVGSYNSFTSNVAAGATSGTGFLQTAIAFINNPYTITGSGAGIVGFYLQNVIEPSFFTIFGIIVSFVISLDFAEIAGDFLGAPSLNAERVLGSKYLNVI